MSDFFRYKLACTGEGCPGDRFVEQALSAGWKLGDVIPRAYAPPGEGTCPICKRTNMKVVEAPPPPEPVLPEGWSKIPTQ